jgi:hypothetical protein
MNENTHDTFISDYGEFSVCNKHTHSCGQEFFIVYPIKANENFHLDMSGDLRAGKYNLSLAGDIGKIEWKQVGIKDHSYVCQRCGESLFPPTIQIEQEPEA